MPATTPQTKVLSDREFVLTHTFRAPASAVFNAYVDPEKVAQWWGRPGVPLRVEALDARPGGKWRFVQDLPNGKQSAAGGTYLEVHPVTRLVYTFLADGMPEEITATVELAERDGVTTLTLTSRCASKEIRDSMLQYGAASGAKAAWDRLAEALAAPAAKAPSPAGRLGYATLFVADQDRALAFYTKVLGFELVGDAPQPGGHRFIALNPPGQQQYVVLWPGTPGRSSVAKGNLPGHLICLVPDIDAAFAGLKARGATFAEHAPVKAPFATFATVVDPDGNRIMVQQQAPRGPGA
jgi:uncharacterized protein YndB with AHSA1/START domain/catechol 2,3-dioxygenase-like lactoylglutathione lyase family enzyme